MVRDLLARPLVIIGVLAVWVLLQLVVLLRLGGGT